MKQYTVIEGYPKHIQEWLRRAEVELTYDESENRLYMVSTNKEAPLTNSEKLKISRYLIMYKHAFRRVSWRESED